MTLAFATGRERRKRHLTKYIAAAMFVLSAAVVIVLFALSRDD